MIDFMDLLNGKEETIEDNPFIELDVVDSLEELEEGFIYKVYPSTMKFDRERVIDINRPDLTFKECTMRAMIGLYVLKTKYSSVEVDVYGKKYTFELKKFATPNKADFVTVHRVITEALTELTGNNKDVIDILNGILLDIQQDKWKFEE